MALIGDFKKQVNSLVAQKASAKKVLASTIGAAQGFQSILPSLDGGGRGLGARAASETPRPNEEVTLPALNLTQSQASETTPSLDQTVSEMGFAASSQPAVTSQPRWKQLAQKAKEDMAATQPALGVENTGDTKRLANHARRAINALAARPTVEPELEENIETFAKLLVETFGSLTAAFEEFDHHGREEITRAQWDAALNARGWDTQEICGIAASKLFSLVSRASKKPIGALTLPAWKSFFQEVFEPHSCTSSGGGSRGDRRFHERSPGTSKGTEAGSSQRRCQGFLRWNVLLSTPELRDYPAPAGCPSWRWSPRAECRLQGWR
ncbi:unnamed protein product [Durusdinium trenchii]|uniref:Defective in cullin neddylation protein n=1 Tax=Durusdinium trenchii TaxID=1381693 RepID=A0ABP0NBP1_9DINO